MNRRRLTAGLLGALAPDAAPLISSYQDDPGRTRPARWPWVCS